jgi:hypothetical protein
MAAIYLQGLMNDFRRSFVLRHNKNFEPGSGRSLQTTEPLTLRNRKPAANSKGKFLFLSSKKDAEGETPRQILKGYLQELATDHGGKLHAKDDEEGIADLIDRAVPSQKPGHLIAARPLFSYSERNTDDKKCKYGAYKDGTRYRCVQNLNHKKGGGGDVTRQASEDRDDGGPDHRTKLQNRTINVPPYVRKRPVRPADQPDEATYPQQTPTVPTRKRAVNKEAARLVDALTKTVTGKRNRNK